MSDVIRTQRIPKRIGTKSSEMMIQQGSVVGSFTTKYKAFPTVFGAVPQVLLTAISGTVTNMRVLRKAAGSFGLTCNGTPIATRNTSYFSYFAYGSV